MKKTSFFKSLPFKLLVAVILGIIAGLILNQYSTNGISMAVLNIVVTVKYILGQIITFCVPLIVLGFIAPSITRLGKNASVLQLFLPTDPPSVRRFFPPFRAFLSFRICPFIPMPQV